MKSGKHLEVYAGLREGIGMKTYLHSPVDFAKTLKLRFRVGDLDLPERRKRRISSREEEEVDAQMCPCGKAINSRTHIVGERETQKERDVWEETSEIDECDMEAFGTLDGSEETIAVLGDKWWPQAVKQEGDNISKVNLCPIWKQRSARSNV